MFYTDIIHCCELPVDKNQMMFKKEPHNLKFNSKRNYQLITPCCNKLNKDGKFVNYRGFNNNYGYCHSCGTALTPPPTYLDEKGNEYIFNNVTQTFEPVLQNPTNTVTQKGKNCNTLYNNHVQGSIMPKKYIDYEIVIKTLHTNTENSLLQYLRSKYEKDQIDFVKQLYCIGTSKNGGTIFWLINKQGKVQKSKISLYTINGKRTNRFEVPYKNEDGYYNCLYGEHLLTNNSKPIILVESEKTAIVSSIVFPQYLWLAYSGINGLTDKKLQILQNEKIIIVPDISENAIQIVRKKLPTMKALNIDVTIYDMTFGKSDNELKECELYNCDIEDILR